MRSLDRLAHANRFRTWPAADNALLTVGPVQVGGGIAAPVREELPGAEHVEGGAEQERQRHRGEAHARPLRRSLLSGSKTRCYGAPKYS